MQKKLFKSRPTLSGILALLLFLLAVAPAGAAPASPTLQVMAGQMLLVGFRGTGLTPSEDLDTLLADVRAGKMGGVIYFDQDYLTKRPVRNIVTVEQVGLLSRKLQEHAPIPLFISIDQEGGRVQRFKAAHGVLPFPSAEALGRATPEISEDTARRMGKVLNRAGINVDYAPCLDLNINPESPAIGALGRSFGPDPETVVPHARAFAQGLWSEGVLPVYKHFPGHGNATDDTHLGLTDISATWAKQELEPYSALMQSGPPAMVMVGHLRNDALDPDLPASLSPRVINGLLRRDMGWQGVVITDDLQMRAITDHYNLEQVLELAVNAGVDIILLGNNLEHSPTLARDAHAALVKLAREGRISEERMRLSYDRIMALKASLAAAKPR